MAGYQQYPREEAPQERKVGIDTSTNYATDQYHEVRFTFSPNYDLEDAPKRLVSTLDRLIPGQPRNRQAQHPLSRSKQS